METKIRSNVQAENDVTSGLAASEGNDFASFLIFGTLVINNNGISRDLSGDKDTMLTEKSSTRALIDSPDIFEMNLADSSGFINAMSGPLLRGLYRFSVVMPGMEPINVVAHSSEKALSLKMTTGCHRTREQLLKSREKMEKSISDRISRPVRISLVLESDLNFL